MAERGQRIAVERIEFLRRLTGYVVLQSEFRVVEPEPQHGQTVLRMRHPLNQYLSTQSMEVAIQIMCDPKYFRTGAHLFVPGASLRLTCVGKVLNWSDEISSLRVLPIALS
jgi:hypothetical protein